MVVTNEKCHICGATTDFVIGDNDVLLREAKCSNCGASIRNSDVAGELLGYINEWNSDLTSMTERLSGLNILNACSSGYIHNALKNLPEYTCCEYLDGVPSGEYQDGVLCVDLCNIPFPADTFDLVITEDVFEHIVNYEKAMEEILRVLKVGGCHIFTVPVHENKKTESREGKQPVYHDDPVRPDDGTRVVTDWGEDIKDIIEKYGYRVQVKNLHPFYAKEEVSDIDSDYEGYLRSAKHLERYLKYNSVVIVAEKAEDKNVQMEKESANRLFTGERFIPGIEDDKLEMEHYQRYLSVRSLVRDKVVLDAACGEGYGSNIIASVAQSVTGLDIDKDTIERAKVNYGQRDNLHFLQGSIETIPMEDASVDVVVSFETIEHVAEQVQHTFLQEIFRVLKKDGILVMSTPNKKIYSDLFHYKNEFHVKEFYHNEFVSFLHEKFKYIKLFNQSFQIVSMLNACDGNQGEIAYFTENQDYIQDGKYYIAIASNEAVNADTFASVYINHFGEYEENIQRILTLQEEEEGRNQHIARLDDELETAGKRIIALQAADEEKNRHIRTLDEHIDELGGRINALNQQNDELNQQNDELNEQNNGLKRKNDELNQQNNELNQQNNELIGQNQELQGVNNALDQKNEELNQRIEDQKTQIADLRQTVLNKEGHIELLLEVERRYEHEKTTHAYKLAKKMQKAGNWLLPLNSRRRFFARIVFNMFRHPRVMLHVINPKRIKNYLKYMRLEGMEGVKKRYEEAVDIERMQLDPSNRLDLELEQVSTESSTDNKTAENYETIKFPACMHPVVSIVIPVYNEFNYTYNCLKSILKNTGDIAYEILIADDCSTDVTKDIEKIAKNVRLITTSKNVRFLLNCNYAAKYAKGKYILFLNNDTQVQANWLEPLVSLIERDEKIGMVGSKLVYPDGYLQEAGGIVWNDASAWNYGNRKSPEDPEYNYVKEADYISGAAIMIRRALWEEIGGFDERFAPAYYEDTDLAFEVRGRGYKVLYQPLSVVVHFEGVSNGTDIEAGLKQYQQMNYQKFYDKWKDILQSRHEPNGVNVFTAKDRSNHKKHMLVVDHYVPHYDQDAGGKCTYMYLKLFVRMGFQVTFIGDNFYKHEPYTTELNQMGIEVLYGNFYYNNWQQWLKENSHYFDYIYLQRPHISVKYIDLVRQYSQAKVFYFAHDLHHIREYREYEMTKNPEKLASSKRWKEIEYDLFAKADVGHVVGSYEQGIIQKAFPDKPIRNIPLYIYDGILDDINKDFSERNDLLYVGGFGHPPNVDAVLWFAKEVYSEILKKYPDMKWHVVGGKVPKEIKDLESPNIIIEGFVSDEALEQLYRACRLAVVPLRFGAGVKGKVVEAAYYQIPLITTSIGAEGLNIEDQSMLIEDDGVKMAEMICSIYNDYDRLVQMSDNGREFIRKNFMLAEAERVIRLDVDM